LTPAPTPPQLQQLQALLSETRYAGLQALPQQQLKMQQQRWLHLLMLWLQLDLLPHQQQQQQQQQGRMCLL
jgi:hypothetical protein